MNPTDTTDQRLTDLEIKASFTEDLLEQLDLVVIRQQQQIDLLVREVARLQQRNANSLDGPRSPTDDLPPHY
jgi:SlyX protein